MAEIKNLFCDGDATIGGNVVIEGSCYVTKGLKTNKGLNWVHSATGTSGSAGYVKIAQITVSQIYRNMPMEFNIACRGMSKTCTIWWQFANLNGTDPNLSALTISNSAYGVYAVKEGTSTWALYVKKTESYDNISVNSFSIGAYNYSGISVAWTNIHATSLPDGYITATAG